MCKVWLSDKNKQIIIIKGVNGSWYSALAKKQFAKCLWSHLQMEGKTCRLHTLH